MELATTLEPGYEGNFWDIFGTGSWELKDQRLVWEAMIRLMREGKLTDEATAQVFLDFRYPADGAVVFSDSSYFADAVKFARRLAFKDFYARSRGLYALMGIAPEIAVITSAQLLVDETVPRALKLEIEQELDEAVNRNSDEPFGQALARLQFPVSDLSLVAQWLDAHREMIPTE